MGAASGKPLVSSAHVAAAADLLAWFGETWGLTQPRLFLCEFGEGVDEVPGLGTSYLNLSCTIVLKLYIFRLNVKWFLSWDSMFLHHAQYILILALED